VNSLVATAILFSLAVVLLVLPLLPVFWELRRKHDVQPLGVIQEYAGEIRHFAGGFRKCLDELQEPLRQCAALGSTATGKLGNGDEYLLLGHGDEAVFRDRKTMRGTVCPLVIAAGVDLTLPSGLTFVKEIYAGGQLIGGEQSSYRAILGDKNIRLQRASKVLRWAHTTGSLQVDHDCDLYGRISSDGDMLLQSGCRFQRLNAPRIRMGSLVAALAAQGTSSPDVASSEWNRDRFRRRKLIEGDWEIGSGELVTEDIVTRGQLRIGAGARVLGSVKSNGDLIVESGVTVEGSLISTARMHIGPRCQIRGPVIAEHGMVIQSGSQCGTVQAPTTVSAPIIDVEEGSLFFGTVWAREQGRVVPPQ
jgi:hypothetical protein